MMGAMTEAFTGSLAALAAAALFFVASHLALSHPALRNVLVERIGETGFRALHGVVALAALVWLVLAYRTAPFVELWPAWAWTRWVPLAAMPFAAILLVCGLSTRSPTAMYWQAPPPGVDPMPGILKLTRHPVMWAVALWAFAHVPPNGDVASLLFFAAFATLALAGMAAIDRRRAGVMGAAWGPIALTTSVLPFAALATGRARLDFAEIGPWRIAAGLVLYAVFLFAHGPLIGVVILSK